MGLSLGGGGGGEFTYKVVIFAIVLTFLIPTSITVFCPQISAEDVTAEKYLEDYRDFTGSNPTSSTQLWALSGIYTPYGVDATGAPSTAYGTTADGWIYGARVTNYSPVNYDNTQEDYTVTYNSDSGLYVYSKAPTGSTSIGLGDTYTSVTMDVEQKSTVFFTSENKTIYSNGFTYDFTGYRYAFQPISNYQAEDSSGNKIDVKATSSSLSLIWYQFVSQSGIAGQLIIAGSDYSVSYLNSTQIVSSFNTTNSTSTFPMTFNGVDMNLVIRINPYYLAQGYTVSECYNLGFWDVMVYGQSVDGAGINSADYSFNVWSVFETLIDLLTFDTAQYGLTGVVGIFASLAVCIPLYAILIAVGLEHYPVLILAAILAAIQSLASFNIWPW